MRTYNSFDNVNAASGLVDSKNDSFLMAIVIAVLILGLCCSHAFSDTYLCSYPSYVDGDMESTNLIFVSFTDTAFAGMSVDKSRHLMAVSSSVPEPAIMTLLVINSLFFFMLRKHRQIIG